MVHSKLTHAFCELASSLEETLPSRWYKDFLLCGLGMTMKLSCPAEEARDDVFAWEQRTFQDGWDTHDLCKCYKSSNQEVDLGVLPHNIFGEPFFGTWS